MRLQKYLARSGVASRRASEELITGGRVSVNGEVVRKLGAKVEEDSDEVFVDGKQVSLVTEKVVLALNKPCGCVTTMSDPQGRKTVSDLIDTETYKGIFPVGRLDINTSGLLLLTNDGELAHKLMHPSSQVKKTYHAQVEGIVSDEEIYRLRSGVDLGYFVTSPAEVSVLESMQTKTTLEIIIHEGKNRQVRRMCKAVGHRVCELKRVKYGNITLDGIKEGSCKKLSDEELSSLRELV